MLDKFESLLDVQERELLDTLNSPAHIQAFLDQTPYSTENANCCPVRVLHDRVAHCLDGALFAALALRRLGHLPLVVDLLPEPGLDDDHIIAIYKQHGYLGAVAKSNIVTLRFREAIYRTLRELVLSYFEFYFNVYGVKSLRSYTRPLDLRSLDSAGWMWSDAGADAVERCLAGRRRVPLVTDAMVSHFSDVDKLTYEAAMLGVNQAGLFIPGTSGKGPTPCRTKQADAG
jgi:hypothetical protein